MIITKLYGGLGNQLFQYALGRHLAYIHNTVLKLDLSWFDHNSKRSYELGAFHIHADSASQKEIKEIAAIIKNHGNTHLIYYIFKRLFKKETFHYIKEKHFQYDQAVIRSPDNSYLDGYWQSERYFKKISETIRNDLVLKIPLSSFGKKILDNIRNTESISLHVRRGDYANDADINAFHGTCSFEYYQKAITYLAYRINRPHIYIFSDDVPWVISNLDITLPHTFIDGTCPYKDQQELILMSNCHHHIIANSTFSWWGAWLNPRSDKMVIAPSKWFAQDTILTQDLLPPEWITM